MTFVTTKIFTFTIASPPTGRCDTGKQGFQEVGTSDYRSSGRARVRQEEVTVSPVCLSHTWLVGLGKEGKVDSWYSSNSLRDCPCHICDIFYSQDKTVHKIRLAVSCSLSIKRWIPRASTKVVEPPELGGSLLQWQGSGLGKWVLGAMNSLDRSM